MVFPFGAGRLKRRTLFAGAGSLLTIPSVARAQGQNGVALVIGNSKYRWEASLPNVKRDVPEIAKRFQALGLKTELLQDVGRDAMRRAIDKFEDASRGANLATFYFAGHGASWERETYLVPADADLSTPSAVQGLLSVTAVNAATKDAAHRLLVFDNCRNNPSDGWRQQQALDAGLVFLKSENARRRENPNRLVLFSTAPGRVALDGPAGEYSPFAAAFLRQLAAGTTDLQLLADKLRRDLLLATQGRQLVYAINSYDHPFRVDGPRDPAAELSGTGLGSVQPVELPRAYVFAKESGFELPTGLVAIRSAANTSDSRKVGAFSCTERYPMGPRPGLLVVLAIDESMTAQILLAGKTDRGAYWRFVTGKVSGERLEFYHRAAGARTLFDWHDGDSGSMSQVWEAVQGPKPYVAKFTRLDG